MSYNMKCLALVAVVVLSIQVGTPVKAQETKVMELKKRAVQFTCEGASFASTTLADFITRHRCYTTSWGNFFTIPTVVNQLTMISNQLQGENPNNIQPSLPNVFRALQMLNLQDIKVVILGQDPTPKPGMATGLAFSLQPGIHSCEVPSVYNMLLELRLEGANVGFDNGDLTPWVFQGVLMLNAALTVRVNAANSHKVMWRQFTALLIDYISNNVQPSVWMLWGTEAKSFKNRIARNRGHYILEGGHPSPVHAAYTNFIGGNYFCCANQFLNVYHRGPINWCVPYQEPVIKPCPVPDQLPHKKTSVVKKLMTNETFSYSKSNSCWLNSNGCSFIGTVNYS